MTGLKKTLLFITCGLFIGSVAHAEVVTNKELIDNRYFENMSMDGWTQIDDVSTLTYEETVDGNDRYVWSGDYHNNPIIYSDKDLIFGESINRDLIAAGAVKYDFSVELNSTYSDTNRNRARGVVYFFDIAGNELTRKGTPWTYNDTRQTFSLSGTVPTEAVYSRVSLHSQHEGYFYAPSLVLSVSDTNALMSHGSLVVSTPPNLVFGLMSFFALAGGLFLRNR